MAVRARRRGRARGMPLWQLPRAAPTRRAAAAEIQIFGGGAHAGAARRHPGLHGRCRSARASFAEALEMDRGGLPRRRRADGRGAARSHGVADEGGYWPAFARNEEALDDAGRARSSAPASARRARSAIALDIAASEFGRDGRYRLGARRARARQRRHDASCCCGWIDALPDRLDRGSARRGRRRRPGRASPAPPARGVQIVGDDFLVTNAARVEAAAADGACNAC